ANVAIPTASSDALPRGEAAPERSGSLQRAHVKPALEQAPPPERAAPRERVAEEARLRTMATLRAHTPRIRRQRRGDPSNAFGFRSSSAYLLLEPSRSPKTPGIKRAVRASDHKNARARLPDRDAFPRPARESRPRGR